MKMIKETPPHVAILPSPGMGHFIPMVELANRLTLQHNLTATLIVPHSGIPGNDHEQKPFLESLPTGTSYVLLPPPDFDDSEADLRFEMRIALTIPRSLPSIRDAFKSLIEKTNLVALVVDFFGTAAFDVANEFKVSPYMFFPVSAMTLSLFLYLPNLDFSQQPIQFPGCSSLPEEDFPFQDRQDVGYKWFVDNSKRYKMAEGIMVNTFDDLEGRVLRILQDQQLHYPPILPIGPVTRRDFSRMINTKQAVDDSECILKWLDHQPPCSILFICFGSFGLLSNSQLQELACGIEMSKKRFIWVVRNGDDDALAFLPQGFAQRTKGRGLLVSNWSPQAQILGHGSTGGFLTHCGWNSVLESVVNGVPMIAWPLYAEQKMNAAMLVEEFKIALRPQLNCEDGLVDRVVVANTVNNLMGGEQGKQLRMRMRDLKVAAEMAVNEDGSSTKSLADLTCEWKKKMFMHNTT